VDTKEGEVDMRIAGVNLKYDRKFGSDYGTTKPEPYDTGKHEFKPSFRSIFVSSKVYPGTSKSFFYITSSIHGKMRRYRTRTWYDTDVGNIFASGKTLADAVRKFSYNFKNRIYNKASRR